MGDFQKSPFRQRTFVILDSIHTAGTVQSLESIGALPENIVVWEKNGIEYVYPDDIVASIFKCAPDQVDQISIQSDEISHNGIVKRKVELCSEVVKSLTSSTKLPDELESKLLTPLSKAIG